MSSSDLKLSLGQQYSAWMRAPAQYRALNNSFAGRPILVTGPYRSGTSWVGQMLAGKGIWHLHEPFNPRHGVWPEYFSYRRWRETDPVLDTLVESLAAGRFMGEPDRVLLRGIAANRRGMPARLGLFRRVIKRVLIKDPIACLLSDYLVRNHGMTAVVVLRHPAGFASSLSRLGWDTAAQIRSLLGSEKLMTDWLDPHAPTMTAAAEKTGLESHVVLFGALWTVLWGFARRSPDFLVVDYEDLCARPESEFSALQQKLNLPLSDDDRRRHARLTQAQVDPDSAATFQVARNTKSSRKAWARRLTAAEAGRVRDVWATFELPFFQEDGDW